MTDTNELGYSRKVADGERLELIMRQVASRFKLEGNVLAEALLDLHERMKAVEGATEELTSSDRWKAFKTVQFAKPSPSASGYTVTAIDAGAQDENGELTATKKNIRQGTTSQTGIVQLSDATDSTSTALAATANAVKTAFDLAASKQDALGISSSGSSTKFLNEKGEWATVATPDVSGKADKVANATSGDVATLDANGNLVDSGVTLDPSTNTIAANISGNAATATSATTASTLSASAITSGDLDNYTSGGKRYFCNAGNSGNVSNKPSGVRGAFALDIIAHSGGITQLLYNRDSNYSYIRCCNNGVTPNTWTAWDRFSLASDVNGAYFATYGSTSHANVLAAIQAGKTVFCNSGTGTEDYAPLASVSTSGVITFTKPTVAGLTAYYKLSSSDTWTSGTSADCRVAFSAVSKSENTTAGCTLTFTAIDGSAKTVTVRNVVNAGNADTVDGYHIVVGSTGTNSNTIYFT